ncbi:MAG: ABC transporter substrate binding protein [Lachnospiraceae bacterium]|nr:ABC transporter substrate binding protein [Lachnospiraceae bacterium]
MFLCVFGLCIILSSTVFAESPEEDQQIAGRVLFISSYSYAWETVPEQMEGIKEALPDKVILDYKFMDVKNANTPETRELFYESIKEYLRATADYDVVIVGDDDAFNFAMTYQEELFPDIPIVFEGVNDAEKALEVEHHENVTGVVENLSYQNTIALAQKLYPKATKLVAILDDTITGEASRKEYYETAKKFPALEFQEVNASTCTQEELIQRVSSLDESSILLYIMCTEDGEGNVYSSTSSVEMITDVAAIPIFSIVSNGVGHGILGGELVSHRKMGYQAGKMAEQILQGAETDSIAMLKNTPKYFCFDEIQMKKYEITKKNLPSNIEIVNMEENFLTRNSKVVKIVFWVIVVLGALLCIMIFDNIRRRKLNGALEKIKETLEEASRYDVMTSLFNRRVFMEEAEKRIKNHEEFGILLMDLDNFKNINDSLGHNNGDVVLKELASRLKCLNDENFQAYRLAGDEFTAIIDSKNPDVVEAYAKEIQFSFKKPYILEKEKYFMHSSIGLSMHPQDGETVSQLVASADAAMYKVKNNGKGGIAFYDSSCDEVVYERKRSGNL